MDVRGLSDGFSRTYSAGGRPLHIPTITHHGDTVHTYRVRMKSYIAHPGRHAELYPLAALGMCTPSYGVVTRWLTLEM